MIGTALRFIQKELEAYIVNREQDPLFNPGGVVDLRSVVLPNGNMNIDNAKHITMMLIGSEEERREGKRPYTVPTENGHVLSLNPPLELNLFVVFLAQSASYDTALHDLSHVIAFFQSNTVFDAQKYPAMNDGEEKQWRQIERLSFRLYNLTFEQQNNVWAMLGIKYMPNVVYKISMLTMFDTRSNKRTPVITEINLTEN